VRKNCYQLDNMLHRAEDIQVTWWCWYYSNIHRKEISEKGIYLLILFSTLLVDYVSSLLFQIVILLTKW